MATQFTKRRPPPSQLQPPPPPQLQPQNAFFFDEDSIVFVCNNRYGFLWVHLAAATISLTIGTIIFIHGIKSLTSQKFKEISKVFVYLFVMCGVSFILSNLSFIAVIIGCTMEANHKIAIYNYSLSVFFYDAELISLILVLLARLYYTFKHGAFDISRRRVIRILVCVFIIFSLQIVSITLFLSLNLIIVAYIISLVAIVWYFILSWILVYMFVKRLQFLAVITAQSLYQRTRDNMAASDKRVSTDDQKQKSSTNVSVSRASSLRNNLSAGLKKQHQYKSLISTASKFVSLSTIAFSTTLFCGIVRALGAISLWDGEFGAAVGILLQFVDGCINMICLWLSYTFSAGYYDKCCLQLDDFCTSCVLRCTSRKIVKKYEKALFDGTRNLDGLGDPTTELEMNSNATQI